MVKIVWDLLSETFFEWNNDKISLLAASLAYYTVFSLAPLLIIVITIASFVFGKEAAKGEIVLQIQDLIGSGGAKFIETTIENFNKPTTGAISSLINLIILLFGASGVFGQLQDALNTIWAVAPKLGLSIIKIIQSRFLSFTMVLGIGFLLLVSLVINTASTVLFNYLGDLISGIEIFWNISDFVSSFLITALLFALIYKVLPDVEIAWSNVWIGAIIASALFTVGKSVLGIYLGNGSFYFTYGAAASPIIVLVWVYYSAQILFFGAEFTKVYTRKYGSINVNADAVTLTE